MEADDEMEQVSLNDEILQDIYSWVDQIPLSRPKKHIARDFSDGVLMAEIIHHFYPRFVELHNYSASNSISRKKYNWETLNKRVLRRMGFSVPGASIEAVTSAKRDAIERVLVYVRGKLAQFETKRQNKKFKKQASREHFSAPQAEERHERMHQAADPGEHHANLRVAAEGTDRSGSRALAENANTVVHLEQTIELLQLKIGKLEQLLSIKDGRIQALESQLSSQDMSYYQEHEYAD